MTCCLYKKCMHSFKKQTDPENLLKEEDHIRGSYKMSRERIMSEKMKFFIAVIALQFCYSGFHVVSRLVLNMGVSKIVYPVYRNIIALFLLAPFAYFLEKKERPPITFHFLVQCFLLALCGITANQVFYLLGLNYASPTFASAMQNSVPAITFAMAAALRLEHVNIKRRDGLAKVLGTIVSVGGATIITLYKGPPLLHQEQASPLKLHDQQQQQIMDVINSTTSSNKQNWTLGCLYLLGHCFSWAAWMVFQAPVLRKYPAKLTVTSFTCLFGLLQFLVIAVVMETDIQLWKIQSTEELLAILYAGVVASGIVFSLQTWCIHKGGPVSVAVFQPVQTVLVAIMASILLGDKLYSGGIVGSIFITLGLYAVLWGKKEEKKSWENREIEENVSLSKPLLEGEEQAWKSLPQTENAAITVKINP